MSGVTIGKSLNNGFAGSYAMQPDMIVDTHPIIHDGAEVFFGQAVIDGGSGAVKKADATATAANFVGLAVREVKTVYSYLESDNGGSYVADEQASILKRGVASVACQVGSPERNGKVYLRIATNSTLPNAAIGGLEASADGEKTVELTNCRWASTKDTNGIAGLRILALNAA